MLLEHASTDYGHASACLAMSECKERREFDVGANSCGYGAWTLRDAEFHIQNDEMRSGCANHGKIRVLC